LIAFTESENGLRFEVRVVPRASKSAVVGEYDGALKIRLAAPPVDGAANSELIRTLAKTFGVPERSVAITSGHSSKTKHVLVEGADPEVLKRFS
jgi:uncharacterized protein (TIGR00251 family)